jgi:hypothetical protein
VQLVSVAGGWELEPSATHVAPTIKYGDVNLDGHVNAQDLVALESILKNVPAYLAGTATYANSGTLIRTTGGVWDNSQAIYAADFNYDDSIDNADVQYLINYLKAGSGSTGTVPEPESLVLMILGGIPGLWVIGKRARRRNTKAE